jgi:hypothetical protein
MMIQITFGNILKVFNIFYELLAKKIRITYIRVSMVSGHLLEIVKKYNEIYRICKSM